MKGSERLAWAAAGSLATLSLLILSGQAKKPGPDIINHAPKVVRAGGFQIWSGGAVVSDVETELAKIKPLESRVAALESDVATLARSMKSSDPSLQKQRMLPSEAVAEFSSAWIAYMKTGETIENLRHPHGVVSKSKSDQEMANALELEQRTRWNHLLEVAKDLPESHAQWRETINAIHQSIGIPSTQISVQLTPPIVLKP